MFEKVESQVNFVHLEHDVLRLWRESGAFEKLRQINRGQPPWSFLDGPITANNPMGVHHAWGRTIKDAYQRYWAMNRRELRYQNGFDCQGLWVEIEVERQLGFKTKRDIEEYGLERFTEACKERVRKYSAVQTEQSVRLGYWMDWSDSYFTMSDENNYTIWRFLKACHERGYLYKGTDVMPWSGRAGSAYSDMEVKEGRKLVTHTSVFVRFPIRGRENEYLLIWTTTPWTLTSNTGVAVNGELEYVKLRSRKDGALYYLAKENLEHKRLEKEFKEGFPPFGKWPLPNRLKTIAQIFKEQGGYDIEGSVLGAEMVGLTYDGPFDELPAQQQRGGFAWDPSLIPEEQRDWPSGAAGHRVFDAGKDPKGAPYVVAGEGTGLVHSAPGCGDVDHIWGQEQQLVAIAPLDDDGKFIDGFGPFEGMKATAPDTVGELLQSLQEKGLLVAREEYPHIYPHCWRTGDELVFRLVDEWFVSMEWREEIKKTARMVTWLPPQMRGEERELDWLTSMKDWMISKKRFWGLALPIWECRECGHIMVMGSREELEERAASGWEDFDGHSPHRPWVDNVKIRCEKCDSLVSRVPDVGNPWLDAGIVAYSTTRYNTDREYWDRWVPADFVTECFPGQFRNWFYAMLAMSTLMELDRESEARGLGHDFQRKPPFRNLLGHGLVMDEDRRQMHKSDGTAIWFEEAAEQIGVDTMRWMFCGQRPTEDLPFGLRHPEEEVTVEGPDDEPITHTVDGVRLCRVTSRPADETRRRVLITLWNSYSFFCNYARLDGFDPQVDLVPLSERRDIDRWILSELQLLIRYSRERFESFELNLVSQQIEGFIDVLSNWYIRRNRDRFWGERQRGTAGERDKLAAHQTLYQVLETLVRLMAPLIPFVTEAMYQNLVRSHDDDARESVHQTEFPQVDDSLVDEELSAGMNAVIRLVGLGRAVREKVRIGVRQPLQLMALATPVAVELEAARRFREEILEELNLKGLEIREPGALLSYSLRPNGKALGPRFGKEMNAVTAAIGALDAQTVVPRLKAGQDVEITLAGGPVSLSSEDMLIDEEVAEGFAVASDLETIVALDVRLTPELQREGLARQIVRSLQNLRKEVGLEIENRIRLAVATDDQELREAMEAYRGQIQTEVLARELDIVDAVDDGHEVEIGRQPRLTMLVRIQKVEG